MRRWVAPIQTTLIRVPLPPMRRLGPAMLVAVALCGVVTPAGAHPAPFSFVDVRIYPTSVDGLPGSRVARCRPLPRLDRPMPRLTVVNHLEDVAVDVAHRNPPDPVVQRGSLFRARTTLRSVSGGDDDGGGGPYRPRVVVIPAGWSCRPPPRGIQNVPRSTISARAIAARLRRPGRLSVPLSACGRTDGGVDLRESDAACHHEVGGSHAAGGGDARDLRAAGGGEVGDVDVLSNRSRKRSNTRTVAHEFAAPRVRGRQGSVRPPTPAGSFSWAGSLAGLRRG